MSEQLWKGVGGLFEKRWLVNAFGPALLFWGAGLWVWVQIKGMDDALKNWQAHAIEVQLFLGAAGLLLVLLTAVLLEGFESALLRFYEGYWPRWRWLARRRMQDLERRQARRHLLRAKLVGQQITQAEGVELARLDADLLHRPRDPQRSMPTRLGDILRVAEDYARQQYGLDPNAFWPRLYPQLSQPLREALGGTQDQLNLMLRLTTLALVYGVAWSLVVIAMRRWGLLWWTLPALPLAWLFWQGAHPAAAAYAALFCSAFDLHRFDVYRSMGWPLPTSPTTEKEDGNRLVLHLLGGQVSGEISYVHHESSVPMGRVPDRK